MRFLVTTESGARYRLDLDEQVAVRLAGPPSPYIITPNGEPIHFVSHELREGFPMVLNRASGSARYTTPVVSIDVLVETNA